MLAVVVVGVVVGSHCCHIGGGGGGGDHGIVVGVGWLSSWQQLLLLGAVAEGV